MSKDKSYVDCSASAGAGLFQERLGEHHSGHSTSDRNAKRGPVEASNNNNSIEIR